MAALFEKVMARIFRRLFLDIFSERINCTKLFVSMWVLPEPAEAFSTVK